MRKPRRNLSSLPVSSRAALRAVFALSMLALGLSAQQPTVRHLEVQRGATHRVTSVGALPDGGLWPVTIDDPFKPGKFITTLGLGPGGVATSGTDYRRWKQGGRLNHHIIDPRTGQPAQTDLISVTVIAPLVTQAEMAAKTVLILGSQRGMEWIEARPDYSALLVLETGEIYCSTRMEAYFWRSDELESS